MPNQFTDINIDWESVIQDIYRKLENMESHISYMMKDKAEQRDLEELEDRYANLLGKIEAVLPKALK